MSELAKLSIRWKEDLNNIAHNLNFSPAIYYKDSNGDDMDIIESNRGSDVMLKWLCQEENIVNLNLNYDTFSPNYLKFEGSYIDLVNRGLADTFMDPLTE